MFRASSVHTQSYQQSVTDLQNVRARSSLKCPAPTHGLLTLTSPEVMFWFHFELNESESLETVLVNTRLKKTKL